ncbi:MAG: hypothetical protein ACOCQ9_00700 [Candidatus Brocadiia bacterium]
MKTAHLVAWLTCLALAFFACVLSVRNAGSILAVKEEAERLREDNQGEYSGETERILSSLRYIEGEISALKGSEITEDASSVEDKLDRLEAEIQRIKKDLEREKE